MPPLDLYQYPTFVGHHHESLRVTVREEYAPPSPTSYAGNFHAALLWLNAHRHRPQLEDGAAAAGAQTTVRYGQDI